MSLQGPAWDKVWIWDGSSWDEVLRGIRSGLGRITTFSPGMYEV